MNLKFHSVLDDVDDAWPGRRAAVLILYGSPFRTKATPGPEGHPLPENDVVELGPNVAQRPNVEASQTASITGRVPLAPSSVPTFNTPIAALKVPLEQAIQSLPFHAPADAVQTPAPSPSPNPAPETQLQPAPSGGVDVPVTSAKPETQTGGESAGETKKESVGDGVIVAGENAVNASDPRPYGEEPVSFFVNHWLENRPPSDSIVICGEEPLQQGSVLLDLCKSLKDEGFQLKLDTRGFYPEKLSDLLPYLDYVSVDIPTRLDAGVYAAALNYDGDAQVPLSNALRSLVFLENWQEPGTREVKTVVIPHRNASPADILSIAESIAPSVDQYALQSYDPVLSLLSPPVGQPIDPLALMELARIAKEKVKRVIVRTPGNEVVL